MQDLQWTKIHLQEIPFYPDPFLDSDKSGLGTFNYILCILRIDTESKNIRQQIFNIAA